MESEAKFRLEHPRALRARLRRAGWQIVQSRRRESNWIYDDAAASLRRRGLLLRLRHTGKIWLLTAKGPARLARGVKRRDEFETVVADGPALQRILATLGWRVSLRYDRFRTSFRRADEPGRLDWDEIPFGTYLELEGPATWIRRSIRELGLDLAQAESRTYPELYAEWRKKQ